MSLYIKSNQEIALVLREMADFMELKEIEFKPRAFRKAASFIESSEEELVDVYKKQGINGLENIPGVGRGIAERVEELLKKGFVKEHQILKKEIPVKIEELTAIEGLGVKTVFELYKKLGVKNTRDLEKAAKAGKISRLEGFGKKTEENILKGISFLKKSKGRLILGFVFPTIEKILNALNNLPETDKVALAGSARRMQETIGDIDLLTSSPDAKKVMDYFVSLPVVQSVLLRGATRASVRLKIGIDADLRVVPKESFGAALQYFTGDKYHNIAVREIAIKKGMKLNEYGLYKGAKLIAGKTEEEIYQKLGLKYIEPEIRTNSGEIEAARENRLPNLIGYGDLQGDLQIQTDWSDGDNSILEMAKAAKAAGLKYIAITDHTKSLAMTRGSDEKKLLRQMREIDKINKQISGIKILKGAEVNILKNGALDIEDKTLAKLDMVGIAVHSNFNMSRKDMTERIKKAMANPFVKILFHPTGRIIHKREGYDLDIDEIIKTAKKTDTVLEINAMPDRLDLKDEFIRKAVKEGVKLAIDSDAHNISHFQYLKFGIAQARRGWAEKKDVINCKEWEFRIINVRK